VKICPDINVVAVSAILDPHKSGRLSVITDGDRLMSSCYEIYSFLLLQSRKFLILVFIRKKEILLDQVLAKRGPFLRNAGFLNAFSSLRSRSHNLTIVLSMMIFDPDKHNRLSR